MLHVFNNSASDVMINRLPIIRRSERKYGFNLISRALMFV